MTAVVLSAILLSLIIYILIGLKHRKSVFDLGDIIPVMKGKTAKVKGKNEFSSSTVATSISLATVVLAFFDLVPGLGLWLLWPAITTALGFLFFGFLAKRIWERMSAYNHRPSLHEFIGTEFNSKNVALVGATFTTLGYLSAFAVELTVGSRFLAGLVPEIPQWITVIVISLVGFIYTGMGGFRTVVVTDRVQMGFVWLLLLALIIFYGSVIMSSGGWDSAVSHIPENVRTVSWSNALIPFVVGIFIMNLFTYISNMALWQRIAGAQEPETVVKGMRKSVYQSLLSWSLFVVVAVGAYIVAKPTEGENFLITTMNTIVSYAGGRLVIFCVTLGLYGAMLSTASTQLIAVSHTIYEDIIAPFRSKKLSERVGSKKELSLSRLILLVSAIVAVLVVELLRAGGFSIADLAFSIYGAALSLVPAILLALFVGRSKLKTLSVWVSISVIFGFVAAWAAAIYGKLYNNGNLVFLAPLFGITFSSLILGIGWVFNAKRRQELENI